MEVLKAKLRAQQQGRALAASVDSGLQQAVGAPSLELIERLRRELEPMLEARRELEKKLASIRESLVNTEVRISEVASHVDIWEEHKRRAATKQLTPALIRTMRAELEESLRRKQQLHRESELLKAQAAEQERQAKRLIAERLPRAAERMLFEGEVIGRFHALARQALVTTLDAQVPQPVCSYPFSSGAPCN